jgi:plasmid stabilization system protein ParE
MSYRVEWTTDAENDLATIWTAATDRTAVTDASARIDAQLARAPLGFGQPWGSSVHRIATDDPIGIEFEIIEDDKVVLVHGVFTVN